MKPSLISRLLHSHLTRWLLTVWLVSLLAACATGPRLVEHGFEFDGHFDKWAKQVDLLEYSYGDQYRMVQNSVDKPRSAVFKGMTALPPGTGVYGAMPVGEFLYVKWRLKDSGEVLEDRVDLRDRLPRDMSKHSLTFVIDGRQLYAYLITPQGKKTDAPPILKTSSSRYYVTFEIYPHNTYKP